MKVNYLQAFFKVSYETCCYFAILIKVAAKETNNEHNLTFIGKCMDIGIDNGFVYMNPADYSDNRNYTVLNPAGFLSKVTGDKYEVRFEDRNYKPAKDEIEIDFMALSEENGKKGIGHFVMPDYDPLKESRTRREGFIYSKRIIRKIG